MDAGELLRDARRECGLDQAQLARRAGTSQTYVSRVERGLVSPSLRTLDRLLHAMGQRLTVATEPLPWGNSRVADLRTDLLALTPEQRVQQAATLSATLTSLAVLGRRQRGAKETATSVRALRPDELLERLRVHGVEFVVIGGFAIAAHGFVRANKDVDIVPARDLGNFSRLAAALRDVGAEALRDIKADELGPAPGRDALASGGNWLLLTRLGRLDVVQDVPGLRGYAQLRDRALEVDGILYAGYEELISMKSARGRPEDLIDIGALEVARRGGMPPAIPLT